jgi:hypothetical protein
MPQEPEVMCHDWCAYRARFDEDAGHASVVQGEAGYQSCAKPIWRVWVGENGAVRTGLSSSAATRILERLV